MRSEIITDEPTMLVRRMVLEPGQATPWHIDSCRRFTVVVNGDRLRIEFWGGDSVVGTDVVEVNVVEVNVVEVNVVEFNVVEVNVVEFDVHPGMVDWDDPDPRIHRAVNVGDTTFEEVVMFLRSSPGQDPQPAA